MDHPQLQELVDAPMERLDVEYKAWLDLRDREVQADLAKHLCAIANHGGGFVVFGIADNMTPVAQPPPEAGPYDQDTLSAIVRRFLTPEFQVTVHTVTASGTGIEHSVVWVPPLEAVPVCSKRFGTEDEGKGCRDRRGYTLHPGSRSPIGARDRAGALATDHPELRSARPPGAARWSRTATAPIG